MDKITFDAIGEYENAVIEECLKEGIVVVDHDAIVEGVRVNGGNVEGIEKEIVKIVHENFEVRSSLSEIIDFIRDGEIFFGVTGKMLTAYKEILVRKNRSKR